MHYLTFMSHRPPISRQSWGFLETPCSRLSLRACNCTHTFHTCVKSLGHAINHTCKTSEKYIIFDDMEQYLDVWSLAVLLLIILHLYFTLTGSWFVITSTYCSIKDLTFVPGKSEWNGLWFSLYKSPLIVFQLC